MWFLESLGTEWMVDGLQTNLAGLHTRRCVIFSLGSCSNPDALDNIRLLLSPSLSFHTNSHFFLLTYLHTNANTSLFKPFFS